jgi:hypothetical protein
MLRGGVSGWQVGRPVPHAFEANSIRSDRRRSTEMKRALLMSFLTGLMAVTAWAQDEGDREQRREERRMRQGRGERGPGERFGGGRERGPRMGRMWDRIAEELELDEEQRVQFDEISAKYRERAREAGERWRGMREEMREVREAGDEERLQELREEMRQGRDRPDFGFSEALEELEPILREDQVARLWEMQDRMQSRNRNRDLYRRIFNDLPDELGLTDEQRDEYDQLLRAQREEMRERWSGVRPLMEEMREAREAGDDARVQELREQMEQSRPNQEAMFEGFFQDLSEILDEEQLERLTAFRETLSETRTGRTGEAEGLREVLRAVKRLKLDSGQKEEIRDIEHEAIAAYRKIPRKNTDEHAALAKEVKAEIIEILDETQVEELERQLTRRGGARRSERRP